MSHVYCHSVSRNVIVLKKTTHFTVDDAADEPFFPESDDDCGILQEENDSGHEPRFVTM